MPDRSRRLRLVVAAGPTREMIDPVRFLSNVSTGTMGYEFAREAKRRRFKVALITGPTGLKPPRGIRIIRVVTAREMKRAVLKCWPETDLLIMPAAVCDYTPVRYSSSKIKRVKQKTIRFKRTPDILKALGKRKGKRVLVGFSLETESVLANALRKLTSKNLDFIVANWYGRGNNPFGAHQARMILIHKSGWRRSYRKMSKSQAAHRLLGDVLTRMRAPKIC